MTIKDLLTQLEEEWRDLNDRALEYKRNNEIFIKREDWDSANFWLASHDFTKRRCDELSIAINVIKERVT